MVSVVKSRRGVRLPYTVEDKEINDPVAVTRQISERYRLPR